MGEIAALFDMDHTLIWKNTGASSLHFAYRLGLVPLRFVAQGVLNILLYRLSLMNIDRWYERNMALFAGTTIEDAERFARQWFLSSARHTIYKEAEHLVEEHRRAGHRLVVISNSPPFFVSQVADALNIQETITTGVEIDRGVLTGRLVRPLCYGEGKRDLALGWAEENGVDLGRSYFYTDSSYDVPLLRIVGFPVAVNPDRGLRRLARAEGWKIVDFERIPAFTRDGVE